MTNNPKTLSEIPVGGYFTFPEGTEDAGIRFLVLEQNGVRALVEARIGMALLPVMIYDGAELVVALEGSAS